MRIFTGLCLIFCFAAFPLLAEDDATQNPFLQFQELFECTFDPLEDIYDALDEIKPRTCRVDGRTVTEDEMRFLILAYKLDLAVSLKQGRKALTFAEQLESLTQNAQIDYDKLSVLKDQNVRFVKDYGLVATYLFTNRENKVFDRIPALLSFYPKDSFEHAKLCVVLGFAFLKRQQPERAIPLMQEAYTYFVREEIDAEASVTANGLSYAYARSGDAENAKKYAALAKPLPEDDMQAVVVDCERKLISLTSYADTAVWDNKQKENFERTRDFVLAHTPSDIQIWGAYILSSLVMAAHDYAPEDILPYLEKSFLYREMIWGDAPVDENMRKIDWQLEALKTKLFEALASTGQIGKILFWSAKFEKSKQRKAVISAESGEMGDLLNFVVRHESARQSLASELAKPEAEQDKRLLRQATEIKREMEKHFDSAQKRLSGKNRQKFNELLADAFIIHPDALTQLSSILPKQVACLQYLWVGEKIILYVVIKDIPPFLVAFDLPDHGRSFARTVVKIRTMFQNNAPVPQLQSESRKLAAFLFPEKLEKILRKMEIRKLVVNASGILRYIPMAALHDGERYLVEKYQITNITGMDLIRLAKSHRLRSFDDVRAVVFADPDGSLPAGVREGKAIAKCFPRSRLYFGGEASLDAFESIAGETDIIHLATHAVLDPVAPERSYILFANNEKWYYCDMAGFNVSNVDSLALSACSTAVSEKSDGGEIEGMAYQLLRKSPSGSVLASFWPVDDSATAVLMDVYYRHIAESLKKDRTLDRGGALHEAQLALLKNPATASPYYWAAFALFGDFR